MSTRKRSNAEPGTGLVPQRFGPGGSSLACGLASAFDYDSTHRLAVTYRLRVNYRHEDGSGSVEAEGVIRTSTPDVTGVVINKFRSRGPRGDQDQPERLRRSRVASPKRSGRGPGGAGKQQRLRRRHAAGVFRQRQHGPQLRARWDRYGRQRTRLSDGQPQHAAEFRPLPIASAEVVSSISRCATVKDGQR